MKLVVINGPNLNLTGMRSPNVYGTDTLETITEELNGYVISCGSELAAFQSNHEGDIIDAIHAAMNEFDGIIINPGAYTHYSYAIRDAIEAVPVAWMEDALDPEVMAQDSLFNARMDIHLSDIHAREPFRAVSVIEPVCIAQICGMGKQGYIEAAKLLLSRAMN